METYIGTKIIKAKPAIKVDGRIYLMNEAIPRSMNRQEGYKVVYEDGYESWSPKDVFEKAFRSTDGLDFGLAVEALKQRQRVAKQSWNKSGMYLELQEPDQYSKMTAPYIYITIDGDYRIPWHPSQADILEDDWMIVNEQEHPKQLVHKHDRLW